MPRKKLKEQNEVSSLNSNKRPNDETQNDLHEETKTAKRTSKRATKRRSWDYDSDSQSQKSQRRCEKAGCNTLIPICFASATTRCAGSGYTSRWYHMSRGEHYCNECFDYFYRSHKIGYSSYSRWKEQWSANGKTEASLKSFMSDQMLPYWVQCTLPECRKWRQLPRDTELTIDLIKNFSCKLTNQKDKKNLDACSVTEDSRVSGVFEPIWIAFLTLPALLKNCPSAQYLQKYYCDGVGLSPTSVVFPSKVDNKSNGKVDSKRIEDASNNLDTTNASSRNPYLQPFYQPLEHGRAQCLRPDVMELDEVKEFPEYSREQVMYLGIRNLIITLWNLNPKEWLTLEKVSQHLICRGLARIRCIYEAERILRYFTKKGTINFGIICLPKDYKFFSNSVKDRVIVIGAGIAGIGTARHLQNLGIQVLVLEGRDRIGGRIWDDNSLGAVVGRGAYIVTGVINNPLTVIADQAGIEMRFIKNKCDLYDEEGSCMSAPVDQRVEFHFNAMLDAVAQWRKGQGQIYDVGLSEKWEEMHKNFLEETSMNFTKIEENLLQFHISNLEYACGSSLRNVSTLQWDQNDVYPQFVGDHTILPCGYSALLKLAAQDLNILLKKIVKRIDYTANEVEVTTADGETIVGSKVVVTVPLAVLQKELIEFVPPLPQKKMWALTHLGAGLIEKVILQFPTRFWDKKIQDADLFGHVPSSADKRGLFSVFYDLTPQNKYKNGNCHILMTYASGDMALFISEKSNEEVIEICMEILRSIFNDQETVVPDPTAWFVTDWKNDPFSYMAYSYICIGGTGDAYDFLAEDLEQKVYFAGEATNRQFPQTVTGAYLSGLREANKIIDHTLANMHST